MSREDFCTITVHKDILNEVGDFLNSFDLRISKSRFFSNCAEDVMNRARIETLAEVSR